MLRTLTAALCWVAWLCVMAGIISGNIDDWNYVSLDLKMAGLMVMVLYMVAALVGVKAFQTLWPRDSDTRPKAGDKGTLGSTRE